jgi:hypothetical protein
MKYTKPFIYTLLFALFSCNTFQSVDSRLIDYVNDLETRSSTMSEKEWEEADMLIEQFKNELDENRENLSSDQISKANKAIGQYAGLRIKSGIKDFKDQLKDLSNQLEGVVQELVDTLNK